MFTIKRLAAKMTGSVTPAQFLGELIEPLGRALTPTSARAILSVRTTEAARQRIADLASRCNEGVLSPEEKAEYQLLVEVGDMVSSKAQSAIVLVVPDSRM